MAGNLDLVNAALLRDADIARLSDRLYEIKATAYRQGLLDAQGRHGGERVRVILSQEIRDAISQASEQAAQRAVQTFNRQIVDWAQRNQGLPRNLFYQGLNGFMRRRAITRGKVVAEIAPLDARLDAEVAFYRENGVEPEFDFVGPRPQCELCRILKAQNPHSIDRVLEVGYPHLNCRHRWKARTRARAALREGGVRPGQISAGRGGPAGILGSEALLQRMGTLDTAIGALHALD